MHIRLKKDINSFENVMVLITSILLIGIFSSQLFYGNLNFTHSIFASDALQHYFLVNFLNEGGDFWDNLFSWNFGPAPSIFPDFILIYFFYNIFNSIFWSVYTVALFQILTTYWLIIGITKHIRKNDLNDPNSGHSSIFITSTLFLIVFAISSSVSLSPFFSDSTIMVYPLIYFTNYHYAPVILGGLLTIFFCLKLQKSNYDKPKVKINHFLLLIIFFSSFLINLSDLLFFSSVVVPIMMTYFILGVITKDRIKKYLIPLLFLVSGLSAHFAKDLLFSNSFKRYIALKFKLFDILELLKNIFLNQMILTVLLLIFFGWVFYRLKKDFLPLLRKWKNKKTVGLSHQEFNKIFTLLLCAFSLFVGIASLQAVGGALYPRYLIFIFFIPLFFTGVLKPTFLTNKWVISGLVLITLSVSVYTMIPPKNSTLKFEYQNANFSCLDKAIFDYNKEQPESKKLRRGIVNYFSTQYDLHNKANVRLFNYSVSEKKLIPYTWLRSKKMFKYHSFDLVIIDPYGYLKINEMLDLLGKPEKKVKCGNITLMIYGRDKIKLPN